MKRKSNAVPDRNLVSARTRSFHAVVVLCTLAVCTAASVLLSASFPGSRVLAGPLRAELGREVIFIPGILLDGPEAGKEVWDAAARGFWTFDSIIEKLQGRPYHFYSYSSDLLRYGRTDTQQSIKESARRLGAQIRFWGTDQSYDIIAHSLGGSVAAYWAATEEDDNVLRSVHTIITLDSPVRGVLSPDVFRNTVNPILATYRDSPAVNELKDAGFIVEMSKAATQVDIFTYGNSADTVVEAENSVMLGGCHYVGDGFDNCVTSSQDSNILDFLDHDAILSDPLLLEKIDQIMAENHYHWSRRNAPSAATAPMAPIGPASVYADLGVQESESNFGLLGWSESVPHNPYQSETGDQTKRFTSRNNANFLTFQPVMPGWNYTLTTEVENGKCDDSFEVWVGERRLYVYQAVKIASSEETFVTVHTVSIPGEAVSTTSLVVTFKNVASDGCGTAAVYNARLDRNDATALAPREGETPPAPPAALPPPPIYSISLQASSVRAANDVTVSLQAVGSLDVGPTSYAVIILDQDGVEIKVCGAGTSCDTTVSRSGGQARTYLARIGAPNGGEVLAESDPATIWWDGPPPNVKAEPLTDGPPIAISEKTTDVPPPPYVSIGDEYSNSVTKKTRIKPDSTKVDGSSETAIVQTTGLTVTLRTSAARAVVGTLVTVTVDTNRDGVTPYLSSSGTCEFGPSAGTNYLRQKGVTVVSEATSASRYEIVILRNDIPSAEVGESLIGCAKNRDGTFVKSDGHNGLVWTRTSGTTSTNTSTETGCLRMKLTLNGQAVSSLEVAPGTAVTVAAQINKPMSGEILIYDIFGYKTVGKCSARSMNCSGTITHQEPYSGLFDAGVGDSDSSDGCNGYAHQNFRVTWK